MIYGAQVFIPVFHEQFSIIENKPIQYVLY